MDIFLDFARRMGFKDKDGAPLIKWSTPEDCFEAWKICSKGRPCDYSGMSYAMLSSRSGVRWPCNERFPAGKDILYEELSFPTGFHECGDYGHDIETGGHIPPESYKANDPVGKAWLKAADYMPPEESPNDDYPFWVSTGRLVYHFHTRTKTGRSPELNSAAPEVRVEVNGDDANTLSVADGDMLDIESRRGAVRARVKISDVLPGHLFIPFHYGYWDTTKSGPGPGGRPSAANELTLTAWDPASKQPHFKFAAVRARKVGLASAMAAIPDAIHHATDRIKEVAASTMATTHEPRRRIGDYLGLLRDAADGFQHACDQVSQDHFENAEIVRGTQYMHQLATGIMERLQPFIDRYGGREIEEPRELKSLLFAKRRYGDFGLLRELHDLFLLASEIHVTNTVVLSAAKELRDPGLIEVCQWTAEQADRQKIWCTTQVNDNAAQSLVVPH